VLCDEHAAALIFDETRTGLRLGPGGAAGLFGVTPDMTCLGGSLSAGLPLAAVGGRKDLILNSASGVGPADAQPAGTELAVAAALTCLQATAEPGIYEQLDETTALVDKGLSDVTTGMATFQTRVCSMLGLFFSGSPVTNGASALKTDSARYTRFHRALLDAGVLIPASPHRPWCVSTAHTTEQIERAIDAVATALAKSA
jgi:glutamate-1-semialdehyde 2,1-aminomutase